MRSLPAVLVCATLAGLSALPAHAGPAPQALTDGDEVRPPLTPAALQDEDAGAGDSGGQDLQVQEQETGRNFDMELGFRSRYLFVPDAILDIWFFDEGDQSYAAPEARPQVHAYTVGLEFVVKSKVEEGSNTSNNGIFYVQWIDSLVQPGYFDDVESPPDPLDGDYLVPTPDLGMVALGANYGFELHMVKTSQTNGNFGMSMLVGAGLGAGFLIGDLDFCRPGDGQPSYERCGDPASREENLEPEPKRLPPVFPILDVNLGLRFNFGDRFVLRLEGGVQDMIYGGGSIGLMF